MRGGQRDQADVVHVGIAPPKTLDGDLLKKAASLIGKEITDTRLLFAGEIPRIIASYPDTNTAEAAARSLRDEGLVAFVCRDSELRNPAGGFVAHTMKSGGKEVIFGDRRGGEFRFEADGAFLIIRGRMPTVAEEKVSTSKMKLNVTATVLAGGIPIMRRVTKESTRGSIQAEDFLRIYDRKSTDPSVEMFQGHIDYSFLGPELAPSAPENFKLVVTKLRQWFPAAIFDERLIRRYKPDIPAASPGEALDINCKLIALCYLAGERRE